LSESCLKKWRRTEVSIPYTGSADAVGRHTITFQIELRSARVPEAAAFYSVTGLDGTPPKRFVVIAVDSVEKAEALGQLTSSEGDEGQSPGTAHQLRRR
jgi:hypothetical protein